jgi:thioredoxin reductase
MDYRYPDLPSVRERWGGSVFHCPFCHGWEVRGKDLAVLGSDEVAMHRALLLTSWSHSVAVLSDGIELPAEQVDKLARAGVEVDPRPVASLQGPGTGLSYVSFADGSTRNLGGLLVGAPLFRRSELPARLGATAAPANPLSAEGIAVDAMMNAGVPGLFAAGDLVPNAPSVVGATASGSRAATAIVGTLTRV